MTGIVWAQALVGNTVYATGRFTKARPGGSVAGSNETTRGNLLAYDITTGKLLPFNHSLNGEGRAIAASPDGKRLYVGGAFSTVDGKSHPRLAAFDLTSGALVASFAKGTNSTILAVAATNTGVYAGGGFSAASTGQSRTRLIAYSSAGALLDWKPAADLTVRALVLTPDRSKVVVGGSFSKINGATFHGLAAVSSTTGAPLPWASQSDTFPIRDDGTNAGITSLSANATTVFLTGYNFDSISKPGGFEGRAAIDPVDGHLIWLNDCHGDSYSAVPIGNVLYSVGHAHDCEPAGYFPDTSPRTWHRALAETISPTHTNGAATHGYWGYPGQPAATLLDWFPTVNTGSYSGSSQGGWSIVGNTSYVSMGGEFTQVNGRLQQALARFTIASKAPNKVGPHAYSGFGVIAGTANVLGVVAVSWKASWDQDNGILTYRLYRDGGKTPIYTTTADSRFWNQPDLSVTDTGQAPSSSHTYRLVVTDPFGNSTSTTNR